MTWVIFKDHSECEVKQTDYRETSVGKGKESRREISVVLIEDQFSSVPVMSHSLPPHGLQHTKIPCPSPAPRAYSNSCPSSRWCHSTILSSVVHFSSCLQSFQAPGAFPMSHFFASGGQTIGVSASASILPMNAQGSLPLGLTSLISVQSKELSRVFSSIMIQKHQFFGTQLSL